MSKLLIKACALVMLAIFSLPAHAATNTTVFPPSNCNQAEMKVIAWQDGAASTYCLNGQEVLRLAIPNCGDGNQVVYRSGAFRCEKLTEDGSIPACGDGEFITSAPGADGMELTCAPVTIGSFPVCSTDQALTSFDGKSFYCLDVQRRLTIPACTSNQALTYNGTTFTCADIILKSNIPTCASDQVLSYNGTTFSCVSSGGGSTGPGNVVGGYSSSTGCKELKTGGAVLVNETPAPWGVSCVASGSGKSLRYTAKCPEGSTGRATGFDTGVNGGEGNYNRDDRTWYLCITN